MANKFIENEIKKIMEDKNLPYPMNVAYATAWIFGNFKGMNIKILDLRETTSLADFFILTSSSNPTQAKSMADEVMRQMKQYKMQTLSVEGVNDAEWVLIDFGDVMCHVFQEHARGVYDLDHLWSHAGRLDIPQSYYTSGDESNSGGSNDTNDYF
jgi:ribosome-associated protein